MVASEEVRGGPPPPAPVDREWRHVASFDGTRLAFRIDAPDPVPAGRVPVVLCNGVGCSDAYWHDLVPLLSAVRPVVRWDYRGHGRSQAPADMGHLGVDAIVRDLFAVLDALTNRVGGMPAVLVGHSYGALLALEAAHTAADRVAGVVAVAGGPPPARSGARALVGEGLLAVLDLLAAPATGKAGTDLWRSAWRSRLPYRVARAIGGTSGEVAPEILHEYFEHVASRDPALLAVILHELERHPPRGGAADLPVPLLALAGDRDGITPLRAMADLAAGVPDGELRVARGGAHTLPAERPAWVHDQLAAFVACLDGQHVEPGLPAPRHAPGSGSQ